MTRIFIPPIVAMLLSPAALGQVPVQQNQPYFETIPDSGSNNYYIACYEQQIQLHLVKDARNLRVAYSQGRPVQLTWRTWMGNDSEQRALTFSPAMWCIWGRS